MAFRHSLLRAASPAILAPRARSRRITTIANKGIVPDVLSKYPELDASRLTVARTKNPKELLPKKELVFGRNFTGNAPQARMMDWPVRLTLSLP